VRKNESFSVVKHSYRDAQYNRKAIMKSVICMLTPLPRSVEY